MGHTSPALPKADDINATVANATWQRRKCGSELGTLMGGEYCAR